MAGSTPNTLTNLIPTLYAALDVVSREMVGFIPSVSMDSQAARAAIGQTIYSFVAPAAQASDIEPNVTPPDDGQQTFGNVSLAITKARRVPIRWQGEESLQMNNNGFGVNRMMVDQFSQAMRTLANEIESDLGGLYRYASRAVIPGDSTLFNSDLADVANIRKVLMDNGAPLSDLQLVIGTTEGAALRTLTQLTRVNESGDTTMLRQGILSDLEGFAIRESAQVKCPEIGTASGGTIGVSAYSAGDTTLALAATGTGTAVAGGVITIGSDPNHYVLYSGDTDISDGGNIVLNAPGLCQAIVGSTSPAIAVYKKSNRNMAFARSAIVLATRLPALPAEGDMAVDRTVITDPRSGLSFEVAKYMQYRQVQYEISIAWGVKAVKSEHIALLCG